MENKKSELEKKKDPFKAKKINKEVIYMKKMPTLFKRQFKNHEIIKCLNKVNEGCEWVL